MEREKMPRINRAAQFAPFDALKGLHEALRIKEYEIEKTAKGELSEEQARKLSKALMSIEKGDTVALVYFKDGYKREIKGTTKIDTVLRTVIINGIKLDFDDILEINLQK